MERTTMSPEMYEGLHNIAVSIFTDCANIGVPFQDCLMAVYLSGLQHGSAAKDKDTRDE
jgi:hypothetical protein